MIKELLNISSKYINLYFGSQNYLEYFPIVTNNELINWIFFSIGEARSHVPQIYLEFGTIVQNVWVICKSCVVSRTKEDCPFGSRYCGNIKNASSSYEVVDPISCGHSVWNKLRCSLEIGQSEWKYLGLWGGNHALFCK